MSTQPPPAGRSVAEAAKTAEAAEAAETAEAAEAVAAAEAAKAAEAAEEAEAAEKEGEESNDLEEWLEGWDQYLREECDNEKLLRLFQRTAEEMMRRKF